MIRLAIGAAVLLVSLIINVICMVSVVKMVEQVKSTEKQVKAKDTRIKNLEADSVYMRDLIFKD
jgi:hypothetical protein